MASEMIGKQVKVYAQGGFAVGTCVSDHWYDGHRFMTIKTQNATAYIDNPGIIFVEDDVKFPKLED
jgi:hypothetical protein